MPVVSITIGRHDGVPVSIALLNRGRHMRCGWSVGARPTCPGITVSRFVVMVMAMIMKMSITTKPNQDGQDVPLRAEQLFPAGPQVDEGGTVRIVK